jgi:hypothetical protein
VIGDLMGKIWCARDRPKVIGAMDCKGGAVPHMVQVQYSINAGQMIAYLAVIIDY